MREAPLKIDMLRKGVKTLQRIYDGLSYAYTEIDLKKRKSMIWAKILIISHKY